MPKKIEPAGGVTIAVCDEEIEGICQYPNGELGPVLIYHDKNGKQINACKKCADHLFDTKAWTLVEPAS